MRLGIVAALPGEARSLTRLRAQGRAYLSGGARIALSGMGASRARTTARELVDHGAKALVSWGTAAAIDPLLNPGDLMLPAEVVASDGRRYATDQEWRGSLARGIAGRVRINYGALAESRVVITSAAAKQQLHQASGAIACDMESAAVAAVAADFGLPFIAVRAIVDDATMALPPAARAAVDEAGALRPFGLLRALVGHPSTLHAQLRSLKQLSVAFRAAQLTLAAAAPALLGRNHD